MTPEQMLVGDAAIETLARSQADTDAGASAHWREMLADFDYSNHVLSGVKGYGGYSARRGLLGQFAHNALQSPFNRIGRQYRRFSEFDRACRLVAKQQRRRYDLDMLRQTLTLSFVRQHLNERSSGETFLVIGDGFGVLTSLLLATHRAPIVVVINLTQSLLIDLLYIRRAFPDVPCILAEEPGDLHEALSSEIAASANGRVVAVRADHQHWVTTAPVDVAFNVASMQEMTPPVIAGYFDTLRSIPGETWFYCCNREEKTLPDGTITRFADYPWGSRDQIAADELCPWHQYYYSTRPPFYRPYDGPLRHRLVSLGKTWATR